VIDVRVRMGTDVQDKQNQEESEQDEVNGSKIAPCTSSDSNNSYFLTPPRQMNKSCCGGGGGMN